MALEAGPVLGSAPGGLHAGHNAQCSYEALHIPENCLEAIVRMHRGEMMYL